MTNPQWGDLADGQDDLHEGFSDDAVTVSDAVAALAVAGIIPPENLPRLHEVIGHEPAWMVSELMDRYDGDGAVLAGDGT